MYRYSVKKYTDSLLAMGVIRIGTLYDFRKIEHRQGIADPKEGKKQLSHIVDYLQVTTPDTLEVKAINKLGVLEIGNNVTLKNVLLGRDIADPDCFIHCTSKVYSKNTMREFEGADTCYEIFNPDVFYSLITETLNSLVPVEFQGIHDVRYQDRMEKWNGKDWGDSPTLIKEEIFSKQSELRAIWKPRFNCPIHPINIADYRIIESCISKYI